MYILLKKDTFCEISIAQKFINLFKFQPPYRKEELEIIKLINKLTKSKEKYSIKSFIDKFNSINPKYEIVTTKKVK